MSHNEHLDKARAALVEAKTSQANGQLAKYNGLLEIATVQAQLATATALQQIAELLTNECKYGGSIQQI